jgi:AraC-like DNA-binding protein
MSIMSTWAYTDENFPILTRSGCSTERVPSASSPCEATLMSLKTSGSELRPGSVSRDGMHVDMQWHYHDMHKLLYAFEGAIEVESTRGRNLIPRQLAAWIPAGVPHCTSIHGIAWVSVFLTPDMVRDDEQRVRTVMVSPLMREMLRESRRWHLHDPESQVRVSFFNSVGTLCEEWIEREAQLFLPTSEDPRVRRVLDHTVQHMDLNLEQLCRYAGISERSLRRRVKSETGLTWEVYRHRCRLLKAVSLLSESETAMSEIAARCGFESASGFAKAFRQAMGEAPRDYRRRARACGANDCSR